MLGLFLSIRLPSQWLESMEWMRCCLWCRRYEPFPPNSTVISKWRQTLSDTNTEAQLSGLALSPSQQQKDNAWWVHLFILISYSSSTHYYYHLFYTQYNSYIWIWIIINDVVYHNKSKYFKPEAILSRHFWYDFIDNKYSIN